MEMLNIELSSKEYKRIFSRIDIDGVTNCWNWCGAKDQQGYGQGFYRGRKERIHRIVYAFLVKPIPRGQYRKYAQLDHICKNTSCCNPKHLELVTQKTNVLRGDTIPAQNSRKTYCIHGHPIGKYSPNSSRPYCKVCDSVRHKKRMSGDNREYWLKKAREAARKYRINKKH